MLKGLSLSAPIILVSPSLSKITRLCLFVLFFLCCVRKIQAQTAKIITLEKLIKPRRKDKLTVNTLPNFVGSFCVQEKQDSSLQVGNKCRKLTQEVRYTKGDEFTYNLLGFIGHDAEKYLRALGFFCGRSVLGVKV